MNNKKKITAITVVILIFVFTSSYLGFAETVADSIGDTIHEWNLKISSWTISYYLSLSSVITVAVLGAIAGFLQRAANSWLKNTAMVCAFLVTIITVVKEQVDLKDHKEINSSIIAAEKLVSQIQSWKGKALIKKDDIDYQMVILDEVQKLTSELYEVQMKISYIPNTRFRLISTAYAAADWTRLDSMAVTKDGLVNIIGIGEGLELNSAREKAKKSIILQIEAHTQNKIKERIQAANKSANEKTAAVQLLESKSQTMAESFIKNLKVRETQFENKEPNTYTFFIWYQVTAKHLDEFINLYASFFTR